MKLGIINILKEPKVKKRFGGIRSLILTFFVILFIASTSAYVIYKSYEKALINSVQRELKDKYTIVKGFLDLLDDKVINKKITLEDAQKTAIEFISGPIVNNGYRDIRKSKIGLSDSVYMYAFSTSGKAIMHPYFEGEELWDFRDSNGNYLIRNIISENRFGKTIEYTWNNPGGKSFEAIDYADYFKPWGWIIGYIENKVVIHERLDNLKDIEVIAMLILIPLGTIIIQLLFVANTKKAKYERKLHYSINYDTLTGLPNRNLFNEKLKKRILSLKDNSQLMGVIVVDIDKFNKINDSMGLSVGDKLLKEVADRLRKISNDKYVLARHSADEFIIFMPVINSIENCTELTAYITETLEKPYVINDYEIYITASMGISIFPYNGQTAETLIKNADTAMNYTKYEGRSRHTIYAPSMDDNAIEQIELENDLRKALNRDELLLNYQPLVDAEAGKIVGMEALIRWNRPGYGIFSPAKFIPIAEETGMIISIGEWVLNTACAQNKTWQDEGHPMIRVSVNISPKQFEQRNFIDTVKRALNKSGLAPEYLELEITEDVIKNVLEASESLRKLKELGVRISLDDFGTGYSSLSYLKFLPIDTLKIDKSFITDVAFGEKEIALTTAVINMGHNLKLRVLAEGVETEEQLNILKNNNCDVIQGFYYSKPVSVEEFGMLLKNGLNKNQ